MPLQHQRIADEFLATETPFTRPQDALAETMTHEDAAWLTYIEQDIAAAVDSETLDAIERKAGYESPVVNFVVQRWLEDLRKKLKLGKE